MIFLVTLLAAAAGAAPRSVTRFFDLRSPACAAYLASARPRVVLARVVLRRTRTADWRGVERLLADPEIARWYVPGVPDAREYFEDMLLPTFTTRYIYRRGDVLNLRFVVEHQTTREIVGLALVQRFLETPGRWEIGYAIGGAHVRRGYASEVIRGLVELIRNVDPRAVVEALPDPSNEPSQNVLAKNGFRAGQSVDATHLAWRWVGF